MAYAKVDFRLQGRPLVVARVFASFHLKVIMHSICYASCYALGLCAK